MTVVSSASGPRPAPSQIELFGMAIGPRPDDNLCALPAVPDDRRRRRPGVRAALQIVVLSSRPFSALVASAPARRGADEHPGLGGRVSIPGLGAYPDTVARKESRL